MELKNEIRNIHLYKLFRHGTEPGFGRILLAQYIPPAIRKQLKAEKVNYLEATGNCYIQADGFF